MVPSVMLTIPAISEAAAIDPSNGVVTRRKEQDTQAWGSLDAFLGSVEKRAWSIARLSTQSDDAAYDIVQDTMLRMFENYRTKPAEEWKLLFFRILNNRIADHHRRRGWKRLQQWFGHDHEDSDNPGVDAVDQLADESLHPDGELDRASMGQALRRALDGLPLRQRQAFLYRQWLGMSVAETAYAMQVSEGSVKTHLSRAMSALRDELEVLKP